MVSKRKGRGMGRGHLIPALQVNQTQCLLPRGRRRGQGKVVCILASHLFMHQYWTTNSVLGVDVNMGEWGGVPMDKEEET